MVNIHYLKIRLKGFFQDNLLIIAFMLIIFVVGIICGSIAANTLTYQQKQRLLTYFGRFFNEINQLISTKQNIVISKVILSNLKFVVLFWFLSLSIVGAIIIPFIIILRGFIVGFASTFLIREMFFKGIVMTMVAILPQNLLIIPGLLLGGFFSLIFVFKLGRGLVFNSKYNLRSLLSGYSCSMLGVSILLLIAALVEIYLVPIFIRMVESFMI